MIAITRCVHSRRLTVGARKEPARRLVAPGRMGDVILAARGRVYHALYRHYLVGVCWPAVARVVSFEDGLYPRHETEHRRWGEGGTWGLKGGGRGPEMVLRKW